MCLVSLINVRSLITQGEVYQVFGEFNRVCEQSRVKSATMRLVSLIACLVSLITYGELNHASSELNSMRLVSLI
jgi:hypothetical protein